MKQHNNGFIQLVTDVKTRIKETDIYQIKEKMLSNDLFHLIDVREESEWQQGYLPNAIHLSKGVIERDIEKKIPDQQAKIILYCGGGFRSALAADNLQKMGYKNVLSMDGGFRAWQQAGFTIVTQSSES